MMVCANPIDRTQLERSTAIDFLRVLATLIVFMLHTTIFTTQFVDLWGSKWPAVFLFKTPAWAGVWIFFILSGYLIGKGWANQSYKLTIKGVRKFYLKRITKVLIPTWFFIFLCCVLVYPKFVVENPKVIIKFLTTTYKGIPGADGIGATWYIFSIMQLYLIAPIIFILVEKVNKKSPISLIVVLVFVVMAGMLYRYILKRMGADWVSLVYMPSFSNLDLFVSGFLLSYISNTQAKRTSENSVAQKTFDRIKLSYLKTVSVVTLLALIIVNCWLYFIDKIIIYQYFLPSLYILAVCFYLFAFDSFIPLSKRSTSAVTDILKTSVSNLVHTLSNVSFEFYLFHSLVLNRIIGSFAITSPIVFHIKVLFFSAAYTILLAYGYSKVFRRNISVKNVSPFVFHPFFKKTQHIATPELTR